jgi:uncharacterized membrane-anchored protein YitT (DUF2179 family)
VFLCVAPATILFFIFMILPTLNVFRMSLYERGAYSPNETFVGLKNFQHLLKDTQFIRSMQNMILLVVGLIFLGKKFAMTTGYASVVMSAELMFLEKFFPMHGSLSNQPMLDLLFAIALPAIASALLFNVGASSGGTDVIALIVEKYTHIHSIAVALFLTDLFMVVAACFVFNLYTALYSFVGLTVKSLVIDAVLERIKMCKAILIICDDKDPICNFVMRKLVRGATYTPCFGAYTDKPHYMIYTTLTNREAGQLQEFIHKENLNAFISMLSTTEVFGKGFNHA